MTTPPRVDLHGWGRHPVIPATVRRSEDLERASLGAGLSRGLGRAYGDAALPPRDGGRPVSVTTLADRILGFDPDTGVLRAEAGLSLSTLMHVFLPRGWFSPVSTGTQYVTLGGMVASDVHGKNHHVHGTFGSFVRALRIRTGTGEVFEATPTAHADLFFATLGGMGLTGHILEVELTLERLPSPWIFEESERHGSLREVFEALTAASEQWPMTVAWVDTSATGARLGRGILNKCRWATPDEAPPDPPRPRPSLPVPFLFPSGVMNPFTVRWQNRIWYWRHGARTKAHVIHPENCFYQLDLLTEWNRGYGKRGFTQYQCVLPKDPALYEELLTRFQALGGCSFVTVFKDCGPEGRGLLSFPQTGTSMALDIPIFPGIEKLVRELNAFVIDHGGRVYLAKDAFTSPDELTRMYPRLPEFLAVRDRYDPDHTLSSAQSVRLLGY
ncbi:MAG: FAD-binding oxidoreductase [Myxococcota bacterium]